MEPGRGQPSSATNFGKARLDAGYRPAGDSTQLQKHTLLECVLLLLLCVADRRQSVQAQQVGVLLDTDAQIQEVSSQETVGAYPCHRKGGSGRNRDQQGRKTWTWFFARTGNQEMTPSWEVDKGMTKTWFKMGQHVKDVPTLPQHGSGASFRSTEQHKVTQVSQTDWTLQTSQSEESLNMFFRARKKSKWNLLGKRRYDEHVFQDWTKFERWANIWILTVRNLKITCKPEHRHVSLHSALDNLVSGGCPEVSLPTTPKPRYCGEEHRRKLLPVSWWRASSLLGPGVEVFRLLQGSLISWRDVCVVTHTRFPTYGHDSPQESEAACGAWNCHPAVLMSHTVDWILQWTTNLYKVWHPVCASAEPLVFEDMQAFTWQHVSNAIETEQSSFLTRTHAFSFVHGVLVLVFQCPPREPWNRHSDFILWPCDKHSFVGLLWQCPWFWRHIRDGGRCSTRSAFRNYERPTWSWRGSIAQLQEMHVSECPEGYHLRTHWYVLDRSTPCVAMPWRQILRSHVSAFMLCYLCRLGGLDVVERSMLWTVLDWHAVIPAIL